MLRDHSKSDQSCWSPQVGGRVGFVETGAMLDIREHRPDIRATLAEAVMEASELQGGADVGVYAAGKRGMIAVLQSELS